MNRFLDRLARLYAPLGRRGLLMDGRYRFAPDAPCGQGGRKAKVQGPAAVHAGAATAARTSHLAASSLRGLSPL